MYFTYREQNRSFENIGLWNNGRASVTGIAEPEQVDALYFSYGVLDTLRVPAALGRWFAADRRVLVLLDPTAGIDVGARAEKGTATFVGDPFELQRSGASAPLAGASLLEH